MLRFPNETRRSEEVREALKREFEFAERLHNVWLRRPKDEYLKKCRLGDRVVNVATLLNVQACRQFRSIVDLCSRCEAHDAGVIARCLYETVLATYFVLKPSVAIHIEQKPNKSGTPGPDRYIPR